LSRDPKTRAGQSLIESCLVIAIACLIFFGLFQVSQLFAAKAILAYSAMAGARARMVGFNTFMVYKVVRAASIPNAGKLENPAIDRSSAGPGVWATWRPGRLWDMALRSGTPSSPQYAVEQSRIPLYLGAEYWNDLDAILRYEHWDSIWFGETAPGPEMIGLRTRQSYPLVYPMHRAFYDADHVDLRSGTSSEAQYVVREAHFPIYLE
jgi:hypothetical protein